MAQSRIVVGQAPVLLVNPNARRASISIIMLPTDIEAGNTGKVFIGKGFVPSATVGSPDQGDILQQGGEFADSEKYDGDTSLFKGAVWANASAAGQVVVVDEVAKPKPVTQPNTAAL